jgi:hypothetical protein
MGGDPHMRDHLFGAGLKQHLPTETTAPGAMREGAAPIAAQIPDSKEVRHVDVEIQSLI